MSIEPTYPSDAAVGDPGESPTPSPGTTGGETLGVVVSAKETKKDAAGARGNRNLMAGAAIGVGSAALVAALLYANRSRRAEPRTEKDPGVARVLGDPQD